MIKEKIQIGKVNSDIRKRIGECDVEINKFMVLLNNLLESENQEKVCNGNFFVVREITDIPGNFDVKTEKAYRYSAYWCYQLNPNKPLESENIYSGAIKQEECLFFKYKDVEKLKDNSSDGEEREFSLTLCGPKIPNESHIDKVLIDSNDKKQSLTSIIKDKNLITCAEEIVALVARRKMLKFIELQEIKL